MTRQPVVCNVWNGWWNESQADASSSVFLTSPPFMLVNSLCMRTRVRSGYGAKISADYTQCAQVFYRTSNTYLFFPSGLSEFFDPMDICWTFNQGWELPLQWQFLATSMKCKFVFFKYVELLLPIPSVIISYYYTVPVTYNFYEIKNTHYILFTNNDLNVAFMNNPLGEIQCNIVLLT